MPLRLDEIPETKQRFRLDEIPQPKQYKARMPGMWQPLDPIEEEKQIKNIIGMSESTGISIPDIDSNYKEMQGKPKPQTWLKGFGPYGAVAAAIPQTGFMADARDEVRFSLDLIQSSHTLADAVMGGQGEAEAYENWLKKRERAQFRAEVLETFSGPVKSIILKNIATAAPMLKSYYEASPYAFGGAVVGMAIATIAGQAAPVPEELITVPAAGKVGAKAGFVVGAKLGVTAGTAEFWYRQGLGDFYGEMINGGADPKVSKIVASIAAVPYAAIEYSQIRQFTPGLRAGVQQTIARSVTRVLADAGRQYGKTLMKEALFEEVLQESVNIAAVDVADYLSGKDVKFDKKAFLERANRLMSTGLESLKSMALLPVPNAAVDIASGVKQAIPSGAKTVKEVAKNYDKRIEKAKTPVQEQALKDLKTFEEQQLIEPEKEKVAPTEAIEAPTKRLKVSKEYEEELELAKQIPLGVRFSIDEKAPESKRWVAYNIETKEDYPNTYASTNIEAMKKFIENYPALTEAIPAPAKAVEPIKEAAPTVEAKQAPEVKEGPSKAARDILGGVEPITQINKALKEAKAIRPKVEAEIKRERKKRVAAAAAVMEKSIDEGAEKSIFRSSGMLKGPLSEQRFSSIRDIMEEASPGSINNAFRSIYENPQLRYFEVLNTAEAFRKLIDGEPITLREVDLIKRHFGIEMAKIAEERVIKSSIAERIVTIWRAGLLTGLKTSMLNELSNLTHGVTETAKDIPASFYDSVASLFTGERKVAFTVKGYLTGIKEGFEKGWEYLKTGYSERDIGKKFDYQRIKFGNSKTAKAFQAYEEIIFHLMGAEDQPFYYGAKARSIFSQAIASGKTRGLKGKELTDYVNEIAENPSDEILENAALDAEVAVFQNRTTLGDLARGIQKSSTIGEVIVPFSRTPSAVAMQIIHYTPIGAAAEVMNQIHEGKFNQRAFSHAFGRATVGTGLLAIGAALVAKGLLLLDYPKGEKERKLWELEGKKPYAVKIGDKWRSVYVLGPAGNVLLIGGYFQKALTESGSPSKAIHIALGGGAKSFSEQTFVIGMNRAIEAIMDPERSAERFVSSLAGSAVPTIIADIARATDYTERRYKGPWQAMANRLPDARESLEPRLDVFGQDLPRYGGNPFEVMIDATRPAKIRQDVVVDEIRRLWDNDVKVAPTQLGNRDGYKILTQKENTILWRRAGELSYRQIFDLIHTRRYKRRKDEDKGKEIEREVKEAKDFARAEAAQVKLNQGKTLQELKDDGLVTSDVESLIRRRK